MSLGRGYLFNRPIADGGSLQLSFGDDSSSEITHFTFKERFTKICGKNDHFKYQDSCLIRVS